MNLWNGSRAFPCKNSQETTCAPATETGELEAVLLVRGVRGRYWGSNTRWRHLGRPTVSTHCLWRKKGRALSTEQEGRLLGAAQKNKSRLIGAFIRIGLLTGMRSSEIRTLQVGRVNLHNRTLRVGKAKTNAGTGREIPMNGALYETLADQVAWLKEKFGEPRPEWYLFPFSDRVKPIDPTRPVTTVKTAWEAVRTTAKVTCRFHDLRHTALTKMAEADVPESTMKALAGHMSRAMLERYSHIRMEAKRRAVESLKLATAVFEVPKDSPKVEQKRRLRVVGK